MHSLPRVTEMFHFTRFARTVLCVQTAVTRHDPCRVSPFGNPRIVACLAAPRGLSQPATSFVAFQRQGIHRVPVATCRDDARARYGVLKLPPWRASHPPPHVAQAPSPGQRPTHETPANQRAAVGDLQSCTACPSATPTTVEAAGQRSMESDRPKVCRSLLRKEVIQPHLPVRLPCYDFVPVAGPTFDGSLPKRGWATGFGCCRLP